MALMKLQSSTVLLSLLTHYNPTWDITWTNSERISLFTLDQFIQAIMQCCAVKL